MIFYVSCKIKGGQLLWEEEYYFNSQRINIYIVFF